MAVNELNAAGQNGQRLMALALAFALAGGLCFGGCASEEHTEAIPLVRTQQADSGVQAAGETYSGTVRGRYETALSFQIGGRLLTRSVEEGSRVSAGQTLFVLDGRDAVQQANSGDAQVAQARAQLDLAQSNLARYTALYEQEVIPAATLQQYQTAYDAAFATYQAALAQAATGHNALGYTNLTAGAPGVIADIKAEEGQVLAAGQTVATLVQTGELEIEIDVPEDKLETVQPGTAASVSFWAFPDRGEVPGVVREVAPLADKATRTYKVRVSLPQPLQGMELGMTASVAFAEAGRPGGTEGGALLPLSAIYQTGDMPSVWLVEGGQVRLQKIRILRYGEGNTVLVTGLAPADTVVTAGVHKLREGQRVKTSEETGGAGR